MNKLILYLGCASILLTQTHQQYAEKSVDRTEYVEQLRKMQEQLDEIKGVLAAQETGVEKRFFGLDLLSTLSCERETLDDILASAPHLFEQVLGFLNTFLAYIVELPNLVFSPGTCPEEESTVQTAA